MNPKRIQLRRSKGWRLPPRTKKVDRTTPWGNPYRVQEYVAYMKRQGVTVTEEEGARACVAAMEGWLTSTQEGRELLALAKRMLRGWNLACWCKSSSACHGNMWIRLVNTGQKRPK